MIQIERRYDYVRKESISNKGFIKRFVCKHKWIDDILSEDLFVLSGRKHIVYCKGCGKIKGYYWEEY
ncbi:hypothetical protein QTH49_13415 [Clostridium perfringens]|nr:hypothetical protein [Clostridium perfringens]